LAGVAAAGKTEVYCRVIEDSLKQGRSALVLVPEVGLAEQMYELLKERFGSEVLFWHGDKTPKERWDDWIQVQKGKFSIVVGPRSAILAPLKNIGVVIVDEEQDSAFKEDRKPRFHVRDVAEKRAEQNSALLLLGSATPSMETMYKVEEGRFQLIDLRHRAVASSAPHVHVVDMKTEKKFFLSTPLEKALEERLKNHEQTILLLNRRGFFRSLRCEDCGWFSKCSTCGLPLVLHSESKKTAPFSPATKKNKPNFPEGAWRCHMCGQKENPPISCPNCGSKKIKGSGSGTQRAAEEIQKRFPWARVLRWDRDSAAKKGKHFEFFKKFKSEEFDILIGTQLVAHGFNFPSVTLVGVMNSDVGLQIPDFRASEKTFQILTQVAGRSGRDIVSGDVYFQTRHADHYAIQSAVKMDFREFSKLEIPFRQELGYPPFTHIVVVRTTGLKKKDAENMTRLTDWAEQAFPEKIRVLGPLQVQHGIPRGQSKFQCVLKIPNELFALFLEEFYKWLPKNSGSFWLDVDPESLN
jgi:primosomal protein N' (replication factor Y)